MRKKGRQYAPTITPPNGFFTLESTLHRCLAPLLSEHLPFLKRLELGAIITVSSIPFSDNVITFAENEGISMHSIISENMSLFTSSGNAEDWMKIVIELLLALGRDPVLLVGSEDNSIDAAVIACVRRLQKWSMTSIIAEFRYLTGRKDFDMEQFIEFFDVNDAVRISRRRMPAYIDVYLRMEEEELKSLDDEQRHLKDACDQICEAPHYPTIPSAEGMEIVPDRLDLGFPLVHSKPDESEPAMQRALDSAPINASVPIPFTKLLFADSVQCITSHSLYDPSISLITEDTADD